MLPKLKKKMAKMVESARNERGAIFGTILGRPIAGMLNFIKEKLFISVILMVAIPSLSVSAEFKASTPELTAQVCFDRPENNGFINIIESKVILANSPTISLVGGQAACAYVSKGKYSVKVVSPDPYPNDGTKKDWLSQEINFEILGNDAKTFLITPGSHSRYEWELSAR